jgi:hypothetical protein
MSDVTPIRDPQNDSLLTPQNAVLALIDYQPEQYAGVGSVGHDELLAHVTMLGRIATWFQLPVVLSTVYVKHGMSGTNQELREALPGVPEIDRTTMNSWEDRSSVRRWSTRDAKSSSSPGFGPKSASPSRHLTHCVRGTKCILWLMRSAVSAESPTNPPYSAWPRPARYRFRS